MNATTAVNALPEHSACAARGSTQTDQERNLIMNWKYSGKLLALGALLVLGVGWSPMVSATGTEAGTLISNDATLNFEVGGFAQTEISTADPDQEGTATFVVDRRLDVLVVEQDGAAVSVAPAATNAILSFDVTNLSNDDIDILLGLSRNAANDVFGVGSSATSDPATVTGVCIDTNTNGSCDVALAQEGTNGDTYRLLKTDTTPGTPVRILVTFTIPASAVNGQFDSWSLVAAVTDPDDSDNLAERDSNGRLMLGTSLAATNEVDDPDNVQNVFGDTDGDLGYNFVADTASAAADTDRSGQHSDTSQFVIAAAAMSIAKSSRVVWDPINGFGFGFGASDEPPFDTAATGNNPRRIPGAVIEYRIDVSNAVGAATATDVVVSDSAPPNTSVVDDTTLFGTEEAELLNVYIDECGGVVEFAVDAETVAGGFDASLGGCAAEASGTVIFYVQID
ncbi:MAG: DUF11 domain-containing protein [Gammaproteobacteria bacterium]|nr:DUF11 domain-containing protein [Gammaproteobacteria bacterium]